MFKRYSGITGDGLWHNNIGFVQLLGLCPLLAVSSTVINGLGLGLATTLILFASNLSVSAIRNLVRQEIRIPAFMLIIASFVTAIDLAMNAWLYDLHKILGIFIPLIVTNCAILGRAEAFASRTTIDRAALDGLMMGLGFTMALTILGGVREIIGSGTFTLIPSLKATIYNSDGILLFILPPGAFIALGYLIVIMNKITRKKS